MAKVTLVEDNGLSVPAGEYGFRVLNAKIDTSKAGDRMIKTEIGILNEDGSVRIKVFEYLVMSASSLWKLTQFLKSCGQPCGAGTEVDDDDIVRDCIGWTGKVKLIVEQYKGNDQNKVAAFVSSDELDFAP